MRMISWILLTIVTGLILLASSGSITIAYFADPSNDVIVGSTSLASLEIGDDVKQALRGRRGTAAAFSFSFAILLLFIILGPYRKGAKWAWWAILCSTGALGCLLLLRILSLGIMQGATIGGFILLVVIPALLLDVKRLTEKPGDGSAVDPAG